MDIRSLIISAIRIHLCVAIKMKNKCRRNIKLPSDLQTSQEPLLKYLKMLTMRVIAQRNVF